MTPHGASWKGFAVQKRPSAPINSAHSTDYFRFPQTTGRFQDNDMEEYPSTSKTILVDVAGEEQGGAGVSQVVEAGTERKISALEEPGEGAVSESGGVDDATTLLRGVAAGPNLMGRGLIMSPVLWFTLRAYG
jgi:hypothetical protein